MESVEKVRVRVLFLGSVAERAGLPETDLDLTPSIDVAGVLKAITDQYPGVLKVRKYLFVSLNGVLVSRDQSINDGDEIALFFRPGGG